MTDQTTTTPKPPRKRKSHAKFREPYEIELPHVDREATREVTKDAAITAPLKDLSELPAELPKRVMPLTGREVPLIPKGYRTNIGLTREEVEARFHLAFELIGGIERFSIWADANPTEFYRVYAKLLPSADITQPPTQAIQINLASGMTIPESPLDGVTLRSEKEVNKRWSADE